MELGQLSPLSRYPSTGSQVMTNVIRCLPRRLEYAQLHGVSCFRRLTRIVVLIFYKYSRLFEMWARLRKNR